MGKGDGKSRKGKIWRGSYGKRRPRPSKRRKTKQEKEAKAAKG